MKIRVQKKRKHWEIVLFVKAKITTTTTTRIEIRDMTSLVLMVGRKRVIRL